MERRGPYPVGVAAPAAAAVATGLLLAPVPTAWLGVWHGQLLDFGHVPLFAALFLAVRVGAGAGVWRPLGAVVAFAGLVEVVQPLVGRSGGWLDFLRGALGACAAALAVRARERRRSAVRGAAYAVCAAVSLIWPVWEVAPYVADTVAGRRAFPALATFSTERELLRWEREQATLARAAGPGARVEFLTGPAEYPGVSLRPVVGDFGGARWLCCAFQVADAPLDLVVSVRTGPPRAGRRTPTSSTGARWARTPPGWTSRRWPRAAGPRRSTCGTSGRSGSSACGRGRRAPSC